MYQYIKIVLAMVLVCAAMALISFLFPFLMMPEDMYTFQEILQSSLEFSKIVFMLLFSMMFIMFITISVLTSNFFKW